MNDAPGNAAAPSDMPHQPSSPGAQLAALRQERGWTVEQVASQLNLAPRQVLAIESDDYASLPGMPIVRGFVRAYAKLLKVDAAPLLAMLGGETVLMQEPLVPRKTLSTPFSEARLPSMSDRPGLSSKWVVGGLLLVLLVVGIWSAQQSQVVADLQNAAATQIKEALGHLLGSGSKPQGGAPEKATPQPETAAPATPPAVTASQPASAPPAESAAVAPAAEQPAFQQPPAPVAETAAPPTGKEVKDTLVLQAREENWVEVRRIDSKRSLLSRLMKPGETETVEITEPVSLVIGNASGIDATLRGEPLEIKPGRSNIARLNLK